MKFKLGELYNVTRGLNELMAIKMPAKAAYRVAKIVRVVNPELTEIEKQRVELVKKHGVADDKGNINVPEDKLPVFTAEFQELLGQEVELDIQPVTEDLLEGVTIAPNLLMALSKFIV